MQRGRSRALTSPRAAAVAVFAVLAPEALATFLPSTSISARACAANVVAALLPSATNPARVCVGLGLALLVTASLLLPFVTLSGFARRDGRASRSALPRAAQARALIGTFVAPGLLEELLYRAALLPRLVDDYSVVDLARGSLLLSEAGRTLPWQAAGALLIFVGMHPVNGILLRPAARSTFCDWRFLVAVAVLGVVCSCLYLETGCVWAPAVLHWLVVAIWLWVFDGMVSYLLCEIASDFPGRLRALMLRPLCFRDSGRHASACVCILACACVWHVCVCVHAGARVRLRAHQMCRNGFRWRKWTQSEVC